jgi:hypothetical protein
VRFARSLALLLVILIAALAPAAYADPPDPSWIGGYWDDDDFDNVVVFLLSTYALIASADLHATAPGDVVAILQSPEPHVVPAPIADSTSPRAPPLTGRFLVTDHRIASSRG